MEVNKCTYFSISNWNFKTLLKRNCLNVMLLLQIDRWDADDVCIVYLGLTVPNNSIIRAHLDKHNTYLRNYVFYFIFVWRSGLWDNSSFNDKKWKKWSWSSGSCWVVVCWIIWRSFEGGLQWCITCTRVASLFYVHKLFNLVRIQHP